MTTKELMEAYQQDILPTYDRFPVAIESGSGATLRDFEGKEYIDFSSGIGVNSIGCGNEKWLSAVCGQAGTLQHISNLFYTEPGLRLARRLNTASGMGGVFFGNSGAEANEGMIKLARKYSFDKYGQGRSNIVTLISSFHGRTVTTLKATGQDKFHNYFFPFTPGFRYAEAGKLESVIKALRSDKLSSMEKYAVEGSCAVTEEFAEMDSCAVMIELIQGEGGVMPLDKGFVSELRALCDENDLLLLIDEVQTGIGRTGTLFTFQQYGIMPDAVSFAKGIAGGLPMGGFLVSKALKNVMSSGTHGSTFGGNPVCCAAALAVLDILEDGVMSEVTAKGEYIRAKISEIKSPYIDGIRGLGLMLGIRIKDYSHKDLVQKLVSNGLICLTAGSDVVRLLPPLTITYDEIDKGLEIFRLTMEELM